jgi:CRISPR-associated protein Csb1
MTINFSSLEKAPRLLLKAYLKPLQGTRFQPTGFPEIGAAEYDGPDGSRMLLVESAQSIANRLEAITWDEKKHDWIPPLRGLSYVRALDESGAVKTTSVQEAHRINSPYIVNAEGFDSIKEAVGFDKNAPYNPRLQLAPVLLKYDVGSLLHGVFLEKVGGVVRLPRMLSGFIEAASVKLATSGGVKVDRVQPTKGGEGKSAKEGYGNVPYSREEYVSSDISSFFNLDLSQLRGYGFAQPINDLLIAIALFKVQSFLATGLRLRTACDLECERIEVQRPDHFEMPELDELESSLPGMIDAAREAGADFQVSTVTYRK